MGTTRARVVLLAILTLVALILGGCGEGQKVGSEKLLEGIDDQGPGVRLGERTAAPKATREPLTVDKRTPALTPTPQPKGTPSYFDVALIADSPYYEPGNRIIVRAGVTLRVTNKDTTPERSTGRSFTDKRDAFHSGMLKPGQTWTWTFSSPGRYEIIDEGLTFATGILEVTQ